MTVFALGLIRSIDPLCVGVSSVYLPKLLDTESPLTTATENGFLVWYWCALWQGEDVPIPPPSLAILILSKLIPMDMCHHHSLVLLWLVIRMSLWQLVRPSICHVLEILADVSSSCIESLLSNPVSFGNHLRHEIV